MELKPIPILRILIAFPILWLVGSAIGVIIIFAFMGDLIIGQEMLELFPFAFLAVAIVAAPFVLFLGIPFFCVLEKRNQRSFKAYYRLGIKFSAVGGLILFDIFQLLSHNGGLRMDIWLGLTLFITSLLTIMLGWWLFIRKYARN